MIGDEKHYEMQNELQKTKKKKKNEQTIFIPRFELRRKNREKKKYKRDNLIS